MQRLIRLADRCFGRPHLCANRCSNTTVRRCLLASVALLAVVGSTSQTLAQLTILSQGNRQLKWQEAQLGLLQQQLSDAQLSSELKLELESQLKWLTAWQPGKLTDAPLWTSLAGEVEPWREPAIDPNGLAGSLRERLLGAQAHPTVDETRELEKLLAAHAEDVGVRQLHLHWLDQTTYRKTYPREIAASAKVVFSLLEAVEAPADELRRARAFCLYRWARALAYRELPEVLEKQPLDQAARDKNAAELLGVYRQLKLLVPEERPEFVLLDVRMLRRDRWHGRALVLLEEFAPSLDKKWLLKKRRDLLRELSWEGPEQEAARIYQVAFPDEQAGESESVAE